MNKVTIRDVARKCGKSRQVVSVVLNNKDYIAVSESTRQEILKTADILKYKPNLSARALVKGKTGCIGFINSIGFQNAYPYYHTQIVNGIENGLQNTEMDYTLLMFGTNLNSTFDRSLELVEQGAVDGLILYVVTTDLPLYEKTVFPALTKKGIPFVVIHSTSQKLKGYSVGLNGEKGGCLAARHMISKGYNTVSLYLAQPGNPRYQEPAEGFRKEWELSGRTWNDTMIFKPDSEHDTFTEAFRFFSELDSVPEALFIPDDVTALAVYQALRARNISIPSQSAIIGFDDLDTFPMVNPLTTLYHPFKEKGERAVNILSDLLNSKKVKRNITLEPRLIERTTC